jgi:lysophospholipase L1-like esterase
MNALRKMAITLWHPYPEANAMRPVIRTSLRTAGRVLAVATAATVAVAVTTSTAANAAAPTGRYVSLGDSYTAGPLIPTQVDLNCLRSNHNYPSLVTASIHSTAFSDVSCSGATTDDILHAGTGELGQAVPAQVSAVNAATALVSVGIGGNDIGFTGIIEACAEASLSSPLGSPCKDLYTAGGTDQLRARIAAAAPKVAAVLAAIGSAGPSARIVVVGYTAILPDSGLGCWPVVPIAYGDVSYLRGIEKALNSMLADSAAAHGAVYADVYTPSVGHDACKSASTRWTEGLVPGAAAAPFHPNATGEQGMATAVLARLNS